MAKLHYFHLNGLCEHIRYMFHYAGEDFEDIRHDHSYFVKNLRDKLPYGQLPLYYEGEKSLNQSLAIARYVASKTDLLPSDLWQQAVLDAAALSVYEFWSKAYPYGYIDDPEEKAAVRKTNIEELIPFYFSRFEKQLVEGNGHFGEKLSWADFILVGILDTTRLFYGDEINEIIAKNYPTIAKLIKEITTLPRVKEYIANRKPYRMPWY